jgi:uncharacterized delta-60 repeat protein
MTKRKLILVIVLSLLVSIGGALSVHGAVVQAWVQRYNNVVSNSMDEAFKVAIDQNGDVIAAGYSDDGTSEVDPLLGGLIAGDMLTTKYSGTDGSVIWQKRHHNPAYTIRVYGIAVDSSRNVIVTGSSVYNEVVSYTAKYAAADGALLWEKITPGGSQAVTVDFNDNVVVAGSGPGGADYIAKYEGENGTPLWTTTATITNYTGWTAIALDGNGNVVALGTSGGGTNADFYTAKYAAADGTLLWQRSYNGPANAYDSPAAIAVDASGNVAVTGSSSTTRGHSADYYTARYASADGALLWERSYNGPPDMQDWPVALAVDAAGNVIVTGHSFESEGNRNYYTVKYAAADGAVTWETRDYAGADSPIAVAVDANGDVLLAGQSWGVNFLKFYIVKYAGGDGIRLQETFGTEGIAAAMAIRGDSIVLAGSSVPNGSHASHYDAYTVKYSSTDGAFVWEQRYNALANALDVAAAVAIDTDGNVAVTGQSVGSEGNVDYYTAKYAGTTGTLLWEKRYNGPGNGTDRAQAVTVDQSGNVIVTGYAWNGTNWDCYTAKYASANGALLWDRRYDGPGNGGDTGYAVAVDGGGNVVVTGDSTGTVGGSDYYTAKYSAADGALLWERRYNGPDNDYDTSRAVAVDPQGNVVVTGYTSVGGYGHCYTAKYAGTDGALLWEKGSDRYGHAFAVAVDRAGNVAITGDSRDEYYTIKLAGADGGLLWERRYNGPGSGSDSAQAVAVDANDNVLVTGYSWNASNNADYYTAKYAAANGALLWEKRYDGPGSGSDSARALAIHPDGNVVVTGESGGDFYTAKYAAADGALLWEQRYGGPVNQYGAAGVAIGRNGMVVVTGAADYFSSAVTRSDYATIAYCDTLPPVGIERIPAGLRVRLIGISGRTYEVQRANSVEGPWSTIATVTAPSNGVVEYVETTLPAGSVFYRARTE